MGQPRSHTVKKKLIKHLKCQVFKSMSFISLESAYFYVFPLANVTVSYEGESMFSYTFQLMILLK